MSKSPVSFQDTTPVRPLLAARSVRYLEKPQPCGGVGRGRLITNIVTTRHLCSSIAFSPLRIPVDKFAFCELNIAEVEIARHQSEEAVGSGGETQRSRRAFGRLVSN